MLPFGLASTVITIALARGSSHLIYFIDLLGAATGALLVSMVLGPLREESSILALAAFAFLASICFVRQLRGRTARLVLTAVAVMGAVLMGVAAERNDRS